MLRPLSSSLAIRLTLRLTPRLLIGLVLALALVLAAPRAPAQATDGVPLMKEPLRPSGSAARAGAAQTITWEQLVPADWDPFKEFKDLNFQILDDGDPRAIKMLKRMREVWDNAPTNPAMVGKQVRIPGFIVPLEDTKEGLKEFLLVPYFGACIHSPPPPANQIVHVLPRTAAKGFRSMDAVWVSGPLAVVKTDSYMGAASYRIEATDVQPYEDRKR